MVTMQQRAPENYDPKDLLLNDETVERIAKEVSTKCLKESEVPLALQKENMPATANTAASTPTSTPTLNEPSVKSVEEDPKREERLRKARKARREFESRAKRKRMDVNLLSLLLVDIFIRKVIFVLSTWYKKCCRHDDDT